MSQPAVNMTELDGALGVLPASSGALFTAVGVCSKGPYNSPSTFGRTRDVIANFGDGPAVEAACHELELYGRPVVIVRTASTTAGAPGTIDVTGVAGTSVATVSGAAVDDYEAVIKIVNGGTIGTAGIVLQYSLDGGRNYSPNISLGTATSYLIPSSGVTFAFAAGTLIAGDIAKTRTVAPQWSTAELGTAIDALVSSSVTWECVTVVGPIDANAFDTLETKMAALRALGKFRWWLGNARTPNVGETEAAYLTALSAIFSAKVSIFGALCAGACKVTSSVSGRKYRRPVSFPIAAVHATASEEVNAADINRGAILGVSIRDANGNPDEHDESLNPGLDDARFLVLRTWEGQPGVYINRPRLFSGPTSDFQLIPHRRVMNTAEAVLRAYFQRRLNKPILVNSATGFILESEALEIESGARSALTAALLAAPKASGVSVALSRTDNLLSSKTLTGDARIVPLAYPEIVNLTVGFSNPATQIQAV